MSKYKQVHNPQITGTNIPYNKGYDAWSQRNYPTADQKGASGQFARADGTTINLWITNIEADFALSGQYAQSRMTRQFYPRSFNDVTLTITGNVASTQEYNRLALFVREHHWKALNYVNQGGAGVDQTIGFHLFDKTPDRFKRATRNTKGSHRPWIVQGYILSMAAGAVAHNVAPEFSIGFMVAASTRNTNTGIWSEIVNHPMPLATIIGLINTDVASGGTFNGYIPAPTPPKPFKAPNGTTAPVNPKEGTQWSIGVGRIVVGDP